MKLRRSSTSRSHRRYRRAGHYVGLIAALLLAVLTALYGAARFYWPTVATRKVDIEALLTRTAQHNVRLGRIEPYWDGLNPGVRVSGATVYGDDGRTASITIDEVQGTVALLPLLWGRVELGRLVLSHPVVTVARRADGQISVTGMTPRPDGPGGGITAWLLQQPNVVVQRGHIRWVDALEPERTLTISQLDISVRNSSDRHRLSAAAEFPRALCQECSIVMDVTGNPFFKESWEGEIDLRAKALDVAALPLIMRERIPQSVRGQFDARVWSDWRDGKPQVIRGTAAVRGLRVPFGTQNQPVSVRELAADVSWRAKDSDWRLELADLKLALAQQPWDAGRVRVAKKGPEYSVEVEHVNLNDVTPFLSSFPGEHPMLQRWVQARPSGALDRVEARVRGAWDAPEDFEIEARLRGVGVAAIERFPGLKGLNGRAVFRAAGGEFDMDTENFSLHLPTVFREPLTAREASANVRWQRTETAWRVIASDMRVKSEDGAASGSMTLDVPYDRSVSPVLRLRVDFRDGNGAHAARYYPVHHLSPRALEWMEWAFIDGRIVSGHVIYEGSTRDFPFDEGQGRFEIQGHVRDATYRYLRGWMPLTQGEANVSVNGSKVRVTGQGRIGAIQVHDVRVNVDKIADGPGHVAQVQGRADGSVTELMSVLKTVEPSRAKWQPILSQIASADGTGTLDLNVRVPIKTEESPSFVAGYRFNNMALRLDTGAGLEVANGMVRFSEAGLRESSVQGQFFGGPLTLVAAYNEGRLRVHADGKLLPAELLRTRRALAERVSGSVDWSMLWESGVGHPQLRFDADLRALRSRLPAPLTKTNVSSLEKLAVVTESSATDTWALGVAAGSALAGKITFNREDDVWRLKKGRIDIGKATTRLPQTDGLEVGAALDALDVDRWLPLLGMSGSSSHAPFSAPEFISALSADIKQLDIANRHWGRMFLHLVRRGAEWRAVLDGDTLAGEGAVALAPNTAPRIQLSLAYLRLPERIVNDSPGMEKEATDPRVLPALDIRALSFEYKQRAFGQLDFAATPYEQGWRIDRMNLARPEMKLLGRGTWRVNGERQSTDITIGFESENMGTTLDAFGAKDQMSHGKVKIDTSLTWPNSPLRPTLAGLDGHIAVSAEKGQFLKFDPGAARLFGLLDLRSIGRYLTLDFSPAFGKGFVFDAIHGSIAIDRGNARTQDLLVKGPSLSLGVRGRIGLANEDYDLAIEASPKFGNTLTLTSWGLFGPQAAAAVLALQRLFKRQIEEGTRITYVIKGPWANPAVTKLGKPKTETPVQTPEANQ